MTSSPFRVFHSLGDAIITTNPTGIVTSWNLQAEKVFNLSNEAAIGKSLVTLLGLTENIFDWAKIEQTDTFRIDTNITSQQDKKLWIDWSISSSDIVYNGEPQFVLIARDDGFNQAKQENIVPDLLQLMIAVSTNEMHFRRLLQFVPVTVWVLDKDIRIKFVTPACTRVLGYKPDELIGKQGLDFLHPDDFAEAISAFAEVVQESNNFTPTEIRFRHAEGHWVPLDTQGANLLGYPGIDGIILTTTDITERKMTTEALAQSENRYRYLAENVSDIIWIRDIRDQENMPFLYASPSVADLMGYPYEEAINLSIKEVFPKNEYERMLTLFAEELPKALMLQDQSYKFVLETVHIRKDGSLFPVEISMRLLYDETGMPYSILGVTRDITERKRGEKALRESEQRFRVAAQIANDVIYEREMTTGVADFFGDIDTPLGYKPGEYPRSQEEGFFSHIHPDDANNFMLAIEQHILTAKPYQCEFRLRHKNGTYRHWLDRGTLIKDESGLPLKWIGVATDITERKRAEIEQKRLIALIESSTEFIGIVSQKGRFIYLNEAGLMMVGFDRSEEVKTATLFDIVANEEKSRFHNDIFPKIAEYGSVSGESSFLHRKSGALLDVEFHFFLLIRANMPNDSATHIAVIVRDISKRKKEQAERELLESQLQQAQKMEAVGRLAGGVAHDFNNLLTGILGYTEMIMTNISNNDVIHADMQEIQKAGKRAAKLTAQLLAFSRKQVIDPKPININNLLDDSTKMLKRLIGEDIELIYKPTKPIGTIKADPHQVEQVLVNLAVNARDAMPGGGKLTIETSNQDVDVYYSRMNVDAKPGPYVMFSVSDNGTGIEPEMMEHLFEPFFTTKEKGKGTGLGLSMIYGIVRQNGGFINVYTEVGIGSTFRIYLPRVEDEAQAFVRTDENTLPTGRETVLLVEDEEMVRNLTRKVLERQGYKVLAAENGGIAYLMAKDATTDIDLLLTDVIMPNMNGKQLYESIRELRPDLRVLYMSGYTEDAIAHHGVLEKGTDFIQKPFSLEAIARKVRSVLDQ